MNLLRPAPPRRSSCFSAVLLWLGVLAIVLHSLAGVGHIRAGKSADGLIEICTAQGMVRIDPATGLVQDQPAPQQNDGKLPCCDLCAACGAPAIANSHPPAVLTVTSATLEAPAQLHLTFYPADHPALTPLVPRGPPVHS